MSSGLLCFCPPVVCASLRPQRRSERPTVPVSCLPRPSSKQPESNAVVSNAEALDWLSSGASN
jgi:hypothetical protein